MTRPTLLALALAAVLADAGGAPPAHAQPAPRPPEQQEADRHFKNGVARFKEGKFVEALTEFERANKISPHPLVLYNIAGCYRELGRYAEAVKSYNQFLKEGPGRVPESRLADARTELAGIHGLVARITVKLDPPTGASLFVDGQPVGSLPEDMPLILTPGEHSLVARATGRAEAKETLRLLAGDVATVPMTLPPLLPVDPGKSGTGTGTGVGVRDPDQGVRVPVTPAAGPRVPRRFAVNAGFGTNALRAAEADTGTMSVGVALGLGSRLEAGVDMTLVAYAVIPSVRVRLAGEGVSLHAVAAAPIAFNDGDDMETFAAGAVGLGLRLRLPSMPGLALRIESYAAFAGGRHGTTLPTFLGGELWF